MTRECEKLSVEELLGDTPHIDLDSVDLYIDVKNKDKILKILKNKKNKTRRILFEIYSLRYNNCLYRKEDVSDKAKNITAMKYLGKGNERIYCKEFFINNNYREKKVVMLTLYSKRETDKKTKKMIENLGGYDYEI